MNKEEYEEMRANIFGLLAKLDEQYIAANTDIKPGTIVVAAGQKCYLKKYKVVGGKIYPILHKLRKDGTYYQNERISISAGAKIVKYEDVSEIK